MIILDKEMPEEIREIYCKIKSEIGPITLTTRLTHDGSFVERYTDDFYNMCLNADLPEDYFWEVFLHEHIHILQYKNGYRDLISTDRITKYLNGVIMDIDVHHRLKNDYHFVYSSNYGEEAIIKGIFNNLELCNGDDAEFHLKIVAIGVVHLTLVYNKEKGNAIAEPLSSANNKFKELYEKFYSLVVNNLKTNADSISYVLREGAKIFGIKRYHLQ